MLVLRWTCRSRLDTLVSMMPMDTFLSLPTVLVLDHVRRKQAATVNAEGSHLGPDALFRRPDAELRVNLLVQLPDVAEEVVRHL